MIIITTSNHLIASLTDLHFKNMKHMKEYYFTLNPAYSCILKFCLFLKTKYIVHFSKCYVSVYDILRTSLHSISLLR